MSSTKEGVEVKPAARPKSRRHHAAHACEQPQPAKPAEELPTTAAPSHLGALISQAPSYRPRARGGFGFVQCDDWT